MMPGVRLRHSSLRSCVYAVDDPKRPYVSPLACSTCGGFHNVKTYHFSLDSDGSTIVSQTIAQRLRAMPDLAGFSIENEVKNPPDQGIAIAGTRMSGIYLKHLSNLKNCTVTIPTARILRNPYGCPTCNISHKFKTYHFNLNADGIVIVSPEIFAKLEEMGLPEFQVVEEVNPSSMTIGTMDPINRVERK